MVFGSVATIRFLRESTSWFIDGTFKSAPKLFDQVRDLAHTIYLLFRVFLSGPLTQQLLCFLHFHCRDHRCRSLKARVLRSRTLNSGSGRFPYPVPVPVRIGRYRYQEPTGSGFSIPDRNRPDQGARSGLPDRTGSDTGYQ